MKIKSAHFPKRPFCCIAQSRDKQTIQERHFNKQRVSKHSYRGWEIDGRKKTNMWSIAGAKRFSFSRCHVWTWFSPWACVSECMWLCTRNSRAHMYLWFGGTGWAPQPSKRCLDLGTCTVASGFRNEPTAALDILYSKSGQDTAVM